MSKVTSEELEYIARKCQDMVGLYLTVNKTQVTVQLSGTLEVTGDRCRLRGEHWQDVVTFRVSDVEAAIANRDGSGSVRVRL